MCEACDAMTSFYHEAELLSARLLELSDYKPSWECKGWRSDVSDAMYAIVRERSSDWTTSAELAAKTAAAIREGAR